MISMISRTLERFLVGLNESAESEFKGRGLKMKFRGGWHRKEESSRQDHFYCVDFHRRATQPGRNRKANTKHFLTRDSLKNWHCSCSEFRS